MNTRTDNPLHVSNIHVLGDKFVGKRSTPEALCALVRKVTNFH